MGDNDTPHVRRRQVLQTVGTSAAVGAVGIGAFTGTAAAWARQTVDFKGCSEVWLVVGPRDVRHDPPTVVRVVVASPDGTAVCRDVELTRENTTRIPGQYGDAPVRKVTAEDGEKVLGVIFYNYNREDRFSSASCIVINDHQCAMTPNTPSFEDATCVQDAREIGGYDCEGQITGRERGPSDGRDSKDEETDDGGRGPPTKARKNSFWSRMTGLLRSL